MSPVALIFFFALVLCAHGTDPCSQPIESGFCKASILSWAYKTDKNACVEFTYGGCRGNDNRFKTKEACEAKCLQK